MYNPNIEIRQQFVQNYIFHLKCVVKSHTFEMKYTISDGLLSHFNIEIIHNLKICTLFPVCRQWARSTIKTVWMMMNNNNTPTNYLNSKHSEVVHIQICFLAFIFGSYESIKALRRYT